MNSTTEDATHGIGAPMELPTMNSTTEDATEHGSMELPFHMRLKSVELSRMRELTGTQPMETAWEQCWQEGITPWDVQGVTPVVAQLLRANQLRDGKALVPGCGSGYDVVAMGSPTRSVIGLDISPTALHQAHQLAHNSPHAAQFVEFQNADFFSFSPPFKFDLVFDYTFFCAIDPSLRPRWAHKMADLLAVDGELITLMFPLDDHEGGPPFAVSMDAYEKVLSPCGFRLVSCNSEIPSLNNRTGLEKLGRWERAVPKLDDSEVTNGGL
ncbi:hypothetical protein KC19_12G135600 [Ceratodon purpureus]|uniref:Thiol methyltransferase 2 n=1 Tax=Ceratodon purpureus TaxID=3225 RepID=A0A8T0G6V7_CERPU|nr:hypothetical protein KC19_12G135600 [Ceratodon purpureus]